MRSRSFAFLALAALAAGCGNAPTPASSYYDERVAPIVQVGCVMQTTGCHLATDRGEAAGNLDLSSFDALSRRRDLLAPYGPYPVGVLLLKGGPAVDIPVETYRPDPGNGGQYVASTTTQIRHAAGSLIQLDSSGYAQLKQWIGAGATRNGTRPTWLATNRGECVPGAGSFPGFDPTAPVTDPLFGRFVSEVQPVLERRCAGSGCHGNPIADLHLSCGDTDEEKRWNWFETLAHIDAPASTSELLRRPLSTFRGGTFHEGGDVFGSTEDADYRLLLAFAEDLVAAHPDVGRPSDAELAANPGLEFFASRVEPVLVREGCMFLNCHSPSMFHDLRLRGGSGGVFSRIAVQKNYDMSRHLLALESADPNESRLIAKNLHPPTSVAGGKGIAHRGGALFEDFGMTGSTDLADPTNCTGVNADTGDLATIPSYCVLVRWHQIERQAAQARGEIFADADLVRSVVWVSRPLGLGDVRDFDTFRGGADLRIADATVAANGDLSLGPSSSLLAGCGLPAGSDVRGPTVSWDGSKLAFAARPNGSSPLVLYWANSDGSGCVPLPGIRPASDTQDGILIHDFDPAFAPDGRLVFASTRGNLVSGLPSGPTRTPSALQPNANLYVREADGSVRQLTFLSNQEVAPNFMGDGRLIFTAEKREPDFHQLALRRINLDGGDYHPLIAQRGSIGFERATEVVELPNRNLVFVAGEHVSADGAGTIAVVNRSIGPDMENRDPTDRAYVHSLTLPHAGAFGSLGGIPQLVGGQGVFRSPAALPTGRILAACDTGATAITAGPFLWSLCELDPTTGAIRTLGGVAGVGNVEAVAVYARPNHGVFASRIDEPNAHTRVDPNARDAIIQVHDFPLLATLVFANARTGRPIDDRIGGFRVFAASPPPAGTTSFGQVSSRVVTDAYGQVYVDLADLGWVPTEPDGSAKFAFRGGTPILLAPTDDRGRVLDFPAGAPFTGSEIQREEMQFYPGERSNQSMRRPLFNSLCGGCHGSITGRELDVVVNVDALTSASRSLSYDLDPVDLVR